MKWVRMKGHSMEVFNTISFGGFFREGVVLGSLQQLVESGIEDVKFGVKFIF
jgi:hypothetical protein